MTNLHEEIAANVKENVAYLLSVADSQGYNVPLILREKAAYLRTKKAEHNHIRAELLEAAAKEIEAATATTTDEAEAQSGNEALDTAYEQFSTGSQGFCAYVESHCGFEISREEIARIAAISRSAPEFYSVWSNDDSWADTNN